MPSTTAAFTRVDRAHRRASLQLRLLERCRGLGRTIAPSLGSMLRHRAARTATRSMLCFGLALVVVLAWTSVVAHDASGWRVFATNEAQRIWPWLASAAAGQ